MPGSVKYQRAWAKANPKKIRDNQLRYLARQRAMRRNRSTWFDAQLPSLRARCKRSGIPFNLKPGDLTPPVLCPALGCRLRYDASRGPKSPTIDRVLPRRGYVRGNVCIISGLANAWKSDCRRASDLRKVADYMERMGRK